MSNDRAGGEHAGIVLSLYDLSGTMVLPWAKAGFECFIVDIQHPKGCTKHPDIPGVWRWGADVLGWLPPREEYRIVFSFSPCDDSAISGARWFQEKGLYCLGDSIRLFARGIDIGRWSGAPYCCEHPRSTIAAYMDREPDRVFHPWAFDWATTDDDNYTKETYIWMGNGFIWPKQTRPAKPPDAKRIWYCPPGDNRKNIRSKTPDGFARAVFMANTGVEGAAEETRQPLLFHQAALFDP